jgi:hypothetical protein
MTTTRILSSVLLIALATTGPVSAQFATPSRPATANPAATLDRITAQVPTAAEAAPAATLSSTTAPGLPPGSYASPWYTDGPGCASPMGGSGPVAYDVYWRTGPSFAFGSGPYTDRLHMGWMVAGGAKSLFFNTEGDAAWTLDLGLSYTYNRGSNDDLLDLFLRQPDRQNPFTGLVEPVADRFETTRIRGLHRTSFNFGIGRDWFLWGVGAPGGEEGTNFRIGTDIGGRWGTSHVDLVPFFEENGYNRRQGVYHGIYFGFHSNVEVPMGGWILFAGSRLEYGYDWMNLVPPVKGDVQNVNLLLTGGIRY